MYFTILSLLGMTDLICFLIEMLNVEMHLYFLDKIVILNLTFSFYYFCIFLMETPNKTYYQ